MWGDSCEDYHYEVNYGDTDHSIQFNHDEGSDCLQIIISGSLLKSKHMFDGRPSSEQIDEVVQKIKKQPFHTHCPWIYANGKIEYRFIPIEDGQLEINLCDLEYEDNSNIL